MARLFASGNYIKTAVNLDTSLWSTKGISLVALVRVGSSSFTRCPLALTFDDTSSGYAARLLLVGNAVGMTVTGMGGGEASAPSVTITGNTWFLIAATKPAGYAFPVLHAVNMTTGAHATAEASDFAGSDPASATAAVIGAGSVGGSNALSGTIAATAVFNEQLGTDQIRSLAAGLTAWRRTSLQALWLLNQSVTTQKVVDQVSGLGEVAINGTSISTFRVPNFTYGHPILLANRVPDVGAPAATAPAVGAIGGAVAYGATVAISVDATASPATATASASAEPPGVGVAAAADAALAGATALDATVVAVSTASASAGFAVVAATALHATPTSSVATAAELASVEASASDATVVAVSNISASADISSATSTAYDATVTSSSSVSAPADVALVAAAVNASMVNATAIADIATASATAYLASVTTVPQVNAPPGTALVASAAYDTAASLRPQSASAAAHSDAYDATVVAVPATETLGGHAAAFATALNATVLASASVEVALVIASVAPAGAVAAASAGTAHASAATATPVVGAGAGPAAAAVSAAALQPAIASTSSRIVLRPRGAAVLRPTQGGTVLRP